MPTDTRDPAEDGIKAVLASSESTAFYMWLLITVSAGIIMAQATYLGFQQPRLSTVDATAAFTKMMVIHAIWLVVTIGFLIFTWYARPTEAWKIHIAVGAVTVVWTVSVLVWSFSDVERLQVSTWRCESSPTEMIVTDDFLDSCTLADTTTNLRLGGDIFLWSADDEHFWRWIVPGEGLATLQTKWPSQTSALYLSSDEAGAEITAGAEDSVPGGNWSVKFDPQETHELRIYFIENGPAIPVEPGTPLPISFMPHDTERMYAE